MVALFGAIYFIQGVAEPNEGLVNQPVASLLGRWGQSAGQISAFTFVLSLPWMLKPLYGLVSDFVPLFGSRRKSYLMAASGMAAVGLGCAFALPLRPDNEATLLWLLFLPSLGVAFCDVVSDALLVEHGQAHRVTGRLQATQWAAIYAATILTGIAGGWVAEHGYQSWAFLACGLLMGVSFSLSLVAVRDVPRPAGRDSFGETVAGLKLALRQPALWAVAGYIALWNFNPFYSRILQFYITHDLKLSESLYGRLVSVMGVASVAASVLYAWYSRYLPRRVLVHGSIALGVVSTWAWWWLTGAVSAYVVTSVSQLIYMTALLGQFELAAEACPPRVAGTVFAALLAVSNASLNLATVTGGWLYDAMKPSLGATATFNLLVLVGGLFTAASWGLAPWLVRGRPVGTPPAE